MVNTCESALKIVKLNKRKWLLRLNQNGNGGGKSAFQVRLRADSTPSGHELSDEEAIAGVRQRFGHASYCLVKQWIWIDLVMPDAVLEELKRSGRHPVMLYAHEVVLDSQRRFQPGDWIRSTPLFSFTDGRFFQTHSTVYVLLGNGVRKSAELSTVIKVF